MTRKRIGIMQPYFFPYIGYYQHIHACDLYVFLDDVAYANLEYVRRNYLLIGGERKPFGIEMTNRSQSTPIKDLQLNPDPKWRRKLTRTIELNYKRAPYFDSVMKNVVLPALESNISRVAELNEMTIRLPLQYLDLAKEFACSSVAHDPNDLVGAERIRKICRDEDAGIFINPMGGMKLYFHDEFAAEGLELGFLKPDFQALRYAQGKVEWSPNLSIVDVLMWNDRDTVRKFLSKYEIIRGHASRETVR